MRRVRPSCERVGYSAATVGNGWLPHGVKSLSSLSTNAAVGQVKWPQGVLSKSLEQHNHKTARRPLDELGRWVGRQSEPAAR